jgi:phosphate transport system permease protein
MKRIGLQSRAVEVALKGSTGAAALTTFGLIFLMLAFLFVYAYPAIVFNGLAFFTSLKWDIGNQYATGTVIRGGFAGLPGASFGAFVFIAGTMLTSCLAMVISVPLSLLVAIALVYRVPEPMRPFANALVGLMAGVPSVVYGLWGLVVLVPFIGTHFGGSGNGLLAATILLSLMVIPIMVATIRDVIVQQSSAIFEVSMALGSTDWQAVTRAVLPSAGKGIGAAVLFAFGRALGETMAVLMVCGSAINTLPHGIAQPVNTIAAVIVSQLESALADPTGMAQRSLAELALTLFVITLGVNGIARLILSGRYRLRGEA